MELMFLQESQEIDLSSIFTEEELKNFEGMTADEILIESTEEFNEIILECAREEAQMAIQEVKGILHEENIISKIVMFGLKLIGAFIKFIGKCIMFVVSVVIKGLKFVINKISSLILNEDTILNEDDYEYEGETKEQRDKRISTGDGIVHKGSGEEIPDSVIEGYLSAITNALKDPNIGKFITNFDQESLKAETEKDLEKLIKTRTIENIKNNANLPPSFSAFKKEIEKIDEKVKNSCITSGQLHKYGKKFVEAAKTFDVLVTKYESNRKILLNILKKKEQELKSQVTSISWSNFLARQKIKAISKIRKDEILCFKMMRFLNQKIMELGRRFVRAKINNKYFKPAAMARKD